MSDRSFGQVVRETWVQWATEQPDAADHPGWLVPWDELSERERDVDERIAQAVLAAAGLDCEALRDALNRDRTGLAAALSEILAACAGHDWLADPEAWGSYEQEERTPATLRKEAGRLLDKLLYIATTALRDSGALAQAAITGNPLPLFRSPDQQRIDELTAQLAESKAQATRAREAADNNHLAWLDELTRSGNAERERDEAKQAMAKAAAGPHLRRYVLPSIGKGEGWAVFVIGSDGYFSGVTDYGDAAHHWSNFGTNDFREFFLDVESEWDYFLRKLFPPSVFSRYDGDRTLERAKATIIELRRRGHCTREEARAEWLLLGFHDDLSEEHAWVLWHDDDDHMVLDSHDTVSCRCVSPDRDALAFVRTVMPRLAVVLRKELEQGIGWNDPREAT